MVPTALTLLALASIGAEQPSPQGDHAHCAVFLAAVEALKASKDLPAKYGFPKEASVYRFALSMPYREAPLSTYLNYYFADLPAKVRASFKEVTLPPDTRYDDFDRTDESDGYAPECRWYQSGRNWTHEAGKPPPPLGYQVVLHQPAFTRGDKAAIVTIRANEIANYGHSIHRRQALRVMCYAKLSRGVWRVKICRPTGNLPRPDTTAR